MDKKGDLSHDIQNELISIMVLQLQHGLATDRMRGYYSITADEYCNISHKEKLLSAFDGYTWMTWKQTKTLLGLINIK